ncbi:MAG: S9 family peptidase [Bacteroides sp.]|nr:S9 family peptidase [Ruminococcus flavefaciens]MCM1554542.1 S9 family peptidase [Bacteroides sp.]
MNIKNVSRICCALALTGSLGISAKGQEKMQNKEITVDSIYFSPDFRQKTLTGISSLLEEKEYYVLEKGVLYQCSRQKNGKEKRAVLVDPAQDARFQGKEWTPQSFAFNADKSRVLLLSDRQAVYRRSALNKAVVWSKDRNGKFSDPLVLSQHGPVQEVSFSPDGQKVSYIRQNNLYYIDLASGKETALTQDGLENRIRNGHTDWVYEEEFGFTKAYDWNPDSKSIAYLKFDESALKEYDMTIWGGLYPKTYRYKYPKAGEENSKVSVWLYNLSSRKNTPLTLKADSIEYYPRIFWNPSGAELVLYTMNRHQNDFRIWGVDMKGNARVLYRERNAAYVDIHDNIYFFKDGKRLLLATEKDGYNHLYLFDMDARNDQGTLLTPGQYDVTGLYGVDEANRRVFFQAAYTSPADRDLMCVDLDGKNLRRPALDLQLKGGGTYATFNHDFTYMVVEHSTANSPASYYLYHIGDQDEQLVRCLLSNNHIEETAKHHSFVNKEFIRIPVPLTGMDANEFMAAKGFGLHRMEQKGAKSVKKDAQENERQVYLQAWIMKPAEIGEGAPEGKKYPVLMFLYGGPGSQQVLNELRPYQTAEYAWYQMLVRQGYVVVCVDNRGTGNRGEAFKKCTYLQLGKYETQDQIAAARYLGGLPYVDASRIGIWGWSYGGFMSSNCLLQGNGVFKAAMAVAPVTNWKYYDNVYTERFMRTPAENPDGYELNSPTHYAAKLTGNYLLVHGTADDNVHFQNSVDLVTALQQSGKQFQFMMYPNKNHGMVSNEGSSRPHLYKLLTDFILKNL